MRQRLADGGVNVIVSLLLYVPGRFQTHWNSGVSSVSGVGVQTTGTEMPGSDTERPALLFTP